MQDTKEVLLDTLAEAIEPLTEQLVRLMYPNLTDKALIHTRLTSLDHRGISTEIQVELDDPHNEVITGLVDWLLVFSLDKYDNLDCQIINGRCGNKDLDFNLSQWKHELSNANDRYSLVGTLGFILRRINLVKGL